MLNEYFFKEKWLIKYLDRYYIIQEQKFYRSNRIIYGDHLIKELNKVFNFDDELTSNTLSWWASSNGLLEENIKNAYNPPWSWDAETAADLQAMHGVYGIDVVAELENMLVGEIQRTMHEDMMRQVREQFNIMNPELGSNLNNYLL